MNRIDRLTAILIHLQTKRVVRAQELADRFNISLRTVYRDVRALEEAGVPIGAEAGVGYFLEGYHLPPVMFTKAEVSALLFGAKLIQKWTDQSVRAEFESALYKIKSVLKRVDQEHIADLEPHLDVSGPLTQLPYATELLTQLQQAVVDQYVLLIDYHSNYNDVVSQRQVEPLGLYHYGSGWHLIAFCRSRHDYRDFRVDRIRQLTNTSQRFTRQERLSLQEYLDRIATTQPKPKEATVLFRKKAARFIQEHRYNFGFYAEEDLGDTVRMHFRTPYLQGLSRWLISYGDSVTVESPESLQTMMQELAAELRDHYLGEPAWHLADDRSAT
ncbi:Helix-turn-helix type 11 domain protein [Fibrisoma limi BUZ 3]|uniref:Helix-turn-helix type 11 domain protein n=1 Tax=Fibrisoma limi BUZ 3 TaxID=1185876 RepID=I2GIW9_9BACT|nr:YafY family protein [Fibrisoma limi]CCH53844.1 Helix-turn-helix type 11 domain protein [Fibrisoma limi BUZ 3]